MSSRISSILLEEIVQSIKQVDGYGSVEIFVQDHDVTQITVRKIKKTSSLIRSNMGKRNESLDKAISI